MAWLTSKALLFILLNRSVIVSGSELQLRTCLEIDSHKDLEKAINDAENDIIMTCPFVLGQEENIEIRRSRVTVVCAKKKARDVCHFNSTESHLNIYADGVTLVGFHFSNSKQGSVHVKGDSISFIDCKFSNNQKTTGGGGAIEIYKDSDEAFIINSEFNGNHAEEGGAIYADDDTNSILVSSLFHDNSAEHGGAISATYGRSIQNDFLMNKANYMGSVIFSSLSHFCDGGENYACSGSSYARSFCDGILYMSASCQKFSNTCEYPSTMPSIEPSMAPSSEPTFSPSNIPSLSLMPTINPSDSPTGIPTSKPSAKPSLSPTKKPSIQPSKYHSMSPSKSISPTTTPSISPTMLPTSTPSITPTLLPTSTPSIFPSVIPSKSPSENPSVKPSSVPSRYPTDRPSVEPSLRPSESPSTLPTDHPSSHPSDFPTSKPSFAPSDSPTQIPSKIPTTIPSSKPSSVPTLSPSEKPSEIPSVIPSQEPSQSPSSSPTVLPTLSISPSSFPTKEPSSAPSISMQPTMICNMETLERNDLIYQKVSSIRKKAQEEGTFQNYALKWILNNDNLYLCPNSKNLLQRYAIAAVMMGLTQADELPQSHECRWEGIKCSQSGEITEIYLKNMKGILPSDIILLSRLRSLTVQEGKIKNIPSNVLDLPNLQNLDLDKNRIKGSLSIENTSVSEILRLDMNFNDLNGSLDFLPKLQNLKEAYLDNNQFNGTIPDAIGQLSNLRILTLHENSLEGSMPESICRLRKEGDLYVLMADCGGENPKVHCTCCTHCFPSPTAE